MNRRGFISPWRPSSFVESARRLAPRLGILCLGLGAVRGEVAHAQAVQTWVALYSGSGAALDLDEITDMVVDSSGNVLVTGYSDGAAVGTNYDYLTIKYSSAGNTLWVARYNGPGNGEDKASAIAMDAGGNVYVTGYSTVPGSGDVLDYATIKYNSSGQQLWIARYDGPEHGNDRAVDIAVDNLGNVHVTGFSSDGGVHHDYATIKYGASGVLRWAVRYDGPGYGEDKASALALDASGNVYVTGYSDADVWGTNYDYATLKYNGAGVQQWVARYNGPPNGPDQARALAVDAAGSVFVTGYCLSAGASFDYLTVKYNSSGAQEWAARYDGAGSGADYATALSLDAAGNALVTGYSDGSTTDTDFDFATVKYSSAGVEQWIARYNGTGYANDEAFALALDADATVYVTGWSQGLGTGFDCATVAYDSSGAQRWVARYDGASHALDGAVCLGLDAENNVYVAGLSYDSLTAYDYITIKYDQTFPISLVLTPASPPIQIPATGGSFDFNIYATNSSDSTVTCDIWFAAIFPDCTLSAPLLGPVSVTFPAGFVMDKDRTQAVPAHAPPGNYIYRGHVGIFPDAIWDTDDFRFEKLGAGDLGPGADRRRLAVEDWENTGESLAEVGVRRDAPPLGQGASLGTPTIFALYPCSPNPFNATTAIRFSLPGAAFIKLDVFDIAGRFVGARSSVPLFTEGARGAPLPDWFEAGLHEMTFDGSNLPSGIYICRLQAEDFSATNKMVLLK